MKRFEEEGITVAKVYFCPHHPEEGKGVYKRTCDCRKPNPGMLFDARDQFNIDLANSILVGDKNVDIEAGIAAGVRINILVKSGHKIDEEFVEADYIIDSLGDTTTFEQLFGLSQQTNVPPVH